ncbi:transposase [Thiovulum sp. ES]|nr:transposase [Thiovulum sp. ES]
MKYELLSTRYAKYLLHAHIVFTPKYRKKIFTKEHLKVMEDTFKEICELNDSVLEEFNGESDHVHLLILYPPRLALSKLINSLKGVSSRKLRKEFKIFHKEYWGDNSALWSRSYFVASVGGAPIEILKKYIEEQSTPQ